MTLVEGIFALVLNLFVIMTTLRSRVLRESVPHVLVANIAVGDLFISIYMIIIAWTRQIMDATQYSAFTQYCKVVGLFFLVGQISSPLMSFIMTLERYLAVVYCMRPHIRITKGMCCIAMVIVWGLSISLAVSFMISPKFSNKTDSMCIPLQNTNNIDVLKYVGGIGVVLYILAMSLYAYLDLDFRKTNQKTVQLQRENRVARRIALIMFTNVLFFILPLVLIVIVTSLRDNILYVNGSLKDSGLRVSIFKTSLDFQNVSRFP
ncbi:D(1C) dopamine receptor-like [Actinia tenebrosa]|uniref:D(1C) dopamine receptor-like n=1 Tax=Actinia tenebrosa TaxID=6105 RepID=A0A6P8HX17_ACTTE|nr:D(1C) dopamine receptor-like [Actinia tenebrosa]